jgi:DNA-binding response OmpR family regulator
MPDTAGKIFNIYHRYTGSMTEQPKNKEMIMLVDDNPLNLQMLEIILKKEGYQTTSVKNGPDAFTIAEKTMPDLIFLDIMMPEIDGYEVCRQLKSSTKLKSIPIIFLTARTDTEGIVKGFELGAADYVTRPFNRVELMARIRTHIALKKTLERVVDLERKNSVLAMIATTNHEINQPLTVLTGNLYLFKSSFSSQELNPDQLNYMIKMDKAAMEIKEILAKFRNAASMRFQKYSGDSQIIVFDE